SRLTPDSGELDLVQPIMTSKERLPAPEGRIGTGCLPRTRRPPSTTPGNILVTAPAGRPSTDAARFPVFVQRRPRVWHPHGLLTKHARLLRLGKNTAGRRLTLSDEQIRLLEACVSACKFASP